MARCLGSEKKPPVEHAPRGAAIYQQLDHVQKNPVLIPQLCEIVTFFKEVEHPQLSGLRLD